MPNDSKPIVLVFNDSPTADTGFGTVTRNIWRRLRDKYSPVFLGVNYDGFPTVYDGEFVVFHTYGDPRGMGRFPNLINEVRPDILFTLNDYDAMDWAIQHLVNARNNAKKDIPWVFYFPVDGKPIYNRYTDIIKTYANQPLTTTKWGQDAILETDPSLVVPYIYHGVDTNIFKKMDPALLEQDKDKTRFKDKFVIFMIGVNQIRKNYGTALEAFAEFCKDKSDVVLHMHTQRTMNLGWDLEKLVMHLSEKNLAKGGNPLLVGFSNGINGPMGIPVEMLAKFYNIADVFLSTNIGEGFCVPYVEAMASELPIIAPNSTVTPEIVGDAGILTEVNDHFYFPFQDRSLQRPLPSKQGIVDALNELYEDKDKREKLGKKGRERILADERFTWDFAAKEVDKYLQKVLADDRVANLEDLEIL